MYGIQGIDDQEALRQLLGTSPMDYGVTQGFQPQQTQQLTQGLLGDTSGLQQEMQALADSDAGAQLAQWAQFGAGGGGTNRAASQRAANENAIGQNRANEQAALGKMLQIASLFI